MIRDYNFRLAALLTVISPALLIWTVPSDIGLSLVALLFLIHCCVEKQWDWCREGWVQALGILWIYIIVRALFAEQAKDALARAVPFVRYILFAIALARWTLQDEKTRRYFMIALTATVLFIAADGFLQWLIGFDIMLNRQEVVSAGGHIRLTGPMSKPIMGIMLTWLSFPALLPLLLTPEGTLQRGKKLLYAVFCVLLVVTMIMLSDERIALLLMLFGLGVAVFLLPLPKRRVVWALASILLVLGALALANPSVLHRQVNSTVDTLTHWQESAYGRIFASDTALIMQHPVTGHGVGQFNTSCKALYTNAMSIANKCSTHPHNIYLEWLIDEGIIGLACFILFLFFVFKDCVQAWPWHRQNPLFIGLLIAFIFRVWPFISSTGFYSRWGAPPFWLVLGALLVYTAKQSEKKRDADLALAGKNSGI